jgi:dTMP kinase
MILHNFAVIEGCDGSGTTTQLHLLKKHFNSPQQSRRQESGETASYMAAEPQAVYQARSLFATKEPTDGPVGLLIRRILKGEVPSEKETLARLFAADRGEHLYAPEGIAKRCERGELVVSDRYTPSSLVYQGLECGKELPESLNAAFPYPELLVYLDIDSVTALGRIDKREAEREIYEHLEFQAKVRAAYLELLPRYEKAGVTVLRLDGTRPPELLAAEIWSAILKMPIMKG